MFKNKKINAQCKSVEGLRQNLLPGRYCLDGFQCKSTYCNQRESVCVGLEKDEQCNEHSDCDVGLYCRAKRGWPFETFCSLQRSEYETCNSDSECQNHQFCWYPNAEHAMSNMKTCMPIYSQEKGTLFVCNRDGILKSTDHGRSYGLVYRCPPGP